MIIHNIVLPSQPHLHTSSVTHIFFSAPLPRPLCWYTTQPPATSVNNLSNKLHAALFTAPPGHDTSATSASWTCPPLALAGTEAPGWWGNVWHGRWCSHVGLRRSCPPHWCPGARAAGPWLAARRTLGALEYGGPERRRSPNTDSCRGRHWTWPLGREMGREGTRWTNLKKT